MERDAIAGIEPVEFDHGEVAVDLGDDAGGHDRGAAAIAFDDGQLRQGRLGHVEGVDQEVLDGQAQRAHRPLHRPLPGAGHPDLVELVGVDLADRGRHGPPPDQAVELHPLIVLELLGVVEPRQPLADLEHHGAGYDRTGQGSQADLIDACHDLEAELAGHPLGGPELGTAGPLHGKETNEPAGSSTASLTERRGSSYFFLAADSLTAAASRNSGTADRGWNSPWGWRLAWRSAGLQPERRRCCTCGVVPRVLHQWPSASR